MLVWPLGLVAAAGLLVARLFPDRLFRWAHCPLHDTTGIPCFTCGSTRGVVALTEGRFADGFASNPLVVMVLALFALWAGYALIASVLPGLRRSLALAPGEKKAARWLAALLLVANWIYLILRF